jgi:hypothetical protein
VDIMGGGGRGKGGAARNLWSSLQLPLAGALDSDMIKEVFSFLGYTCTM